MKSAMEALTHPASTTGWLAVMAVSWITVVWVIPAAAQSPDSDRFWGQWRGPDGTGVAQRGSPPLEWNETKNIRWKVEVPGRGTASPIIWEDKVFLLTAVPVGAPVPLDAAVDDGNQAPRSRRGRGRGVRAVPMHRFTVIAIDRETGEIAWQRIAREEVPHEGHQAPNGTFASGSAVTDGEYLFAFFGSWGLYAYDMNGNLQWDVDLGTRYMRNAFGEGTTPALHGNTLVVTWDHIGGQSFVVALDRRTGDERWRVNRNEIDTWATPLIVEHEGHGQVIVPAMDSVQSYDLETGRIVWRSHGTTMNAIPSPVYADGIVYVMSGYRGNNLQAIRLADATGDITNTDAIIWELDRDTPYVPSPLLYDDGLYVIKSNDGILSVFDPLTGEAHYQRQRLEGVSNVFASPVGASGRVYITGRDGTTIVIRKGRKHEVLASNTLDDGFDASPAIVNDEIYLRGHRFLYAIAER